MRYYKLTYLISPQAKEKDLRKIREKLNFLIKEKGGIIENSEIWGKKKLSYKIEDEDEAILANFNFYLDPEKIGDFEREIKSEKKILRYFILKKEKKKAKAEKPKKIKRRKVELEKIEEKLKEILNES